MILKGGDRVRVVAHGLNVTGIVFGFSNRGAVDSRGYIYMVRFDNPELKTGCFYANGLEIIGVEKQA